MGVNLRWQPAMGWLRWGAACLLVIAVGYCTSSVRAGTIIIDNFEQPSLPSPAQTFVVPEGTNSFLQFNQAIPSGVIGGQRDTLIQIVGDAVQLSAIGTLGHDPNSGIHALQMVTSGVAPTVATLQYSGLHSPGPGSPLASLVNMHDLGDGLGIDLTNGGTNDRFLTNFLSVDAVPTSGLEMAITITSPGGKTSTANVIVPNSPNEFDFSVPFNLLVGNASPTEVDSITFVFNGANLTTNIDYKLQTLAVVPEPAAGILMAMAAGALGLAAPGLRRRRRSCENNAIGRTA